MEFQGQAAGDSRNKSLLVMKLKAGIFNRKLKIINDFIWIHISLKTSKQVFLNSVLRENDVELFGFGYPSFKTMGWWTYCKESSDLGTVAFPLTPLYWKVYIWKKN